MTEKTLLAFVSADKEILELAQSLNHYEIMGAFDPQPHGESFKAPILGPDSQWHSEKEKHPQLKIALALDPPHKKKKLIDFYGKDSFVTLLSLKASLSRSAQWGKGCIIQEGVTILADAQIGSFCKVNVNATIHHDCTVGDFCTLAPGCSLLGYVTLEDEVFVGAGATILPRVKVRKGSIIGAGSVVIQDVSAGETVVGVPAKPIKK